MMLARGSDFRKFLLSVSYGIDYPTNFAAYFDPSIDFQKLFFLENL